MLITLAVQVAKESNELAQFAVKVVKTLKEKGEIVALLPDALKAIDGIGEVLNEWKENRAEVLTAVALALVDASKLVAVVDPPTEIHPVG